jgi:hypothetical protein
MEDAPGRTNDWIELSRRELDDWAAEIARSMRHCVLPRHAVGV